MIEVIKTGTTDKGNKWATFKYKNGCLIVSGLANIDFNINPNTYSETELLLEVRVSKGKIYYKLIKP